MDTFPVSDDGIPETTICLGFTTTVQNSELTRAHERVIQPLRRVSRNAQQVMRGFGVPPERIFGARSYADRCVSEQRPNVLKHMKYQRIYS
jgi:hypothetical protein